MTRSCKLQDAMNACKNANIPAKNNGMKTSAELSKIEMPDFDGKRNNWNHFHELFENIIYKP